MTPYYSDSFVTLYHGDCLDVLPAIVGVDMVFADLPYGNTNLKWDKRVSLAELWSGIRSSANEGASAIFFAQQPFATEVINSNPKGFRYELIWDKIASVGFLNANVAPLRQHENILVFRVNSTPKYNPQKIKARRRKVGGVGSPDKSQHYTSRPGKGRDNGGEAFPTSIIRINNVHMGAQHPTQKPIALCSQLIRTFTDEGETVFDPTCGSGSSLVAAKGNARKAIGVEISEKYCEVAAKRLQLCAPLFEQAPEVKEEIGLLFGADEC